MTDQLQDFFIKGYYIFDGKIYYDFLQPTIAGTEFKNFGGDEYHPSTNEELIKIMLLQTHLQIAQDIVEKYFQTYVIGRRKLWEGVNPGALKWHNDLKDHTNTFFLLYHNDTSEETGGAINFRYGGVEEKIYPQAGTLIFFNSENDFEHKAENSKRQRVVSSYYFDIPHGYVYDSAV